MDFLLSRMLRMGRLPGYNAGRTAHLKGGVTLHYRFNRGDLQSLREVWIEEVYACELPFEVRTVLDLGANIGLTSVWLASHSQGAQKQSNSTTPCHILAVEAVLANAEVAVKNFRDNQLKGEVIHSAVGAESGEAWFLGRAESNLGHLTPDGASSRAFRVPVIGICELLDRFPGGAVDLVKMDIEGGEAGLLGQNTEWLARVRALMIEWHDDQTDSRLLIQAILNRGFQHQHMNTAYQDNLSLFWHP